MKAVAPGNISWKSAGFILLLGDLLVLVCLYTVAHYLRLQIWPDLLSVPFLVVVAALVVTLYILDVYRVDVPIERSRLPATAAVGGILAIFVSAIFVYFMGPLQFASIYGRGIMPVVFVLFSLWAAWSRYRLSRWAESRQQESHWLYIGGVSELAYLLRDFKLQPRELTILLTEKTGNGEIPKGFSGVIAGSAQDLVEQELSDISGIILADEYDFDDEQIAVLMQARARGTQIHVLTAFYEEYLARVPVQHLKYGWFVYGGGFYLLHGTFSMKAKRLVDFMLAAVLLVVLLPLLLVVALLIKLDSRGPVFYVQQRMGLNSQVFKMIKFRSMVADAERQGVQWAGKNDARITRIGKFLRKSRLDELPQLWNVLVGDMSFIGPRPERPEFIADLEKQIPFYELRHLVKPGITGWAQVMYPYGASVEDALQKLQYDLFYIKNYSIFLDLIIAIKTARIMIWHQGR